MKYYILPKGDEYSIVKVYTEDDESFREKNSANILVEADSIMQLLLRFEQDILYGRNCETADE